MYKQVTGCDIRSFKDVIMCHGSIEVEILKSVIIKSLIQISRSHNVPDRVIALDCARFVRIEAISNKSIETSLLNLATKLGNIQ